MKVTHVSLLPTESAQSSDRPALTPELLAASAARYSRNNEGLESILSRIDHQNLDHSVDSIFRMLDYGHQSIADMVPVAMFMDGISMWLAYTAWSLCPTAGGQESSTRYIELSQESIIPAKILGIPEPLWEDWHHAMTESFEAYQSALQLWKHIGEKRPGLTAIPASILADKTDKGSRKALRMQRNYRFDRARYYLPLAAATNVMLIMSARGWAGLCQYLSSHPLPEAQLLADHIRNELKLVAPRLMKHAERKDSIVQGIADEFQALVKTACESGCPDTLSDSTTSTEWPSAPTVAVLPPPDVDGAQFARDLAHHNNRYAWTGSSLHRTAVRFGWQAMAIRDLNRHRTGSKYCPLRPLGFYSSLDQLPGTNDGVEDEAAKLKTINSVGQRLSARAHSLLEKGDPSYIYWTLMGTQFPFEHVTTADKFIYEAELRTGMGSHFRYAMHLKEALCNWYSQFPETRELILEGDAEPE